MKENVTAVLQHRAEQVRLGAQVLIDKTRDWQLIKQYMNNRSQEFQLTPTQQLKLDRYQFIYNQLVTGKNTKQDVISQLMRLHKVSMPQAYEDLNYSQELFTSLINVNRQYEINLQLEIAKDAQRKCLEISDFKNAAAFAKIIVAATSLLPEEDSAPGADFEGHQLEAVFDPLLLGAPEIDMMEVLKAVNAKRKVEIKTDMFEEISYIEKKNEETTAL